MSTKFCLIEWIVAKELIDPALGTITHHFKLYKNDFVIAFLIWKKMPENKNII